MDPTPMSDDGPTVVTYDEFERIELRRYFEAFGSQRAEAPLKPRTAVPRT